MPVYMPNLPLGYEVHCTGGLRWEPLAPRSLDRISTRKATTLAVIKLYPHAQQPRSDDNRTNSAVRTIDASLMLSMRSPHHLFIKGPWRDHTLFNFKELGFSLSHSSITATKDVLNKKNARNIETLITHHYQCVNCLLAFNWCNQTELEAPSGDFVLV